MTAVPEHVPQPPTSGRHARPQVSAEPRVPGDSEVTDRLFIPPGSLPPSRPRPPSQAHHHAAGHAVPAARVVITGRPTGLAMTRRHPVGAWLGLPLVTLGIYTFVWYYKIHREMAGFERRRPLPVAGPMLVLLFLWWTGIAPLVSFFNTGNRIADVQRAAGLRPTCNPWIGLLLCFCFGLQVLYYQLELNKIVDSYGVPGGTEVALRA